jgi:hypothetical protein
MAQPTLLDRDFCKEGHDIRDKDKSLALYTYAHRVVLKCRKCATARTKRYYEENIKGKVSQAHGKARAERAILRAQNDAKPRTPSAVKTDALTMALRNEVFALAVRLTDADLMALVIQLRNKA